MSTVLRGGLHGEHLGEAPLVARLAAERRAEECDGALEARLGPDHTRAQGEHVHVVVFDALVRGISVVTDRRTDAAHLVGRHRGADARATDQDAAIRRAVLDRLAEALREVGVIVGRIGAVPAEVDQLVSETGRRETADQGVLHLRPRVIGREGDPHQLWPGSDAPLRATPASPLPIVGCFPKCPPSSVGMRPRRPSRTTRRATSVTRSAVNPNFSKIVPAGADAPKWSSPMIAPSSPTQRSQPSETPTSTLTRFRTDGGRTASRYDWSCRSNRSQHGSETTRVGMPSPSSVSAAAYASCSSDPVPMRISCGDPPDASRRT